MKSIENNLLTYHKHKKDLDSGCIFIYEHYRFYIRLLIFIASPLLILFGGVPLMLNIMKDCINNESINSFILEDKGI